MDDNTLPEVDQGESAEETLPEAPAPEAPDPGDEPVEETNAQPVEKPDGIQKRIDKLTRARYEAEREAAYWRGKAEGGGPVSYDDTAHDPTGKPSQEQFESYEQYLEALTDWKLSARLDVERERLYQEQQVQTAVRGYEAQVQAVRGKHADFDAVVYNPDLPVSETMRDAILQSVDGAALAYHLGQHPEEARRIANLHPMAQVMAIGRIQASIEAQAARGPSASNAPAPITPVRASAPGHTGLREDLSIVDWMKRRNADLRKR